MSAPSRPQAKEHPPCLPPKHDAIYLKPVFVEKIWGGRRLETEFGYEIPTGPIGER